MPDKLEFLDEAGMNMIWMASSGLLAVLLVVFWVAHRVIRGVERRQRVFDQYQSKQLMVIQDSFQRASSEYRTQCDSLIDKSLQGLTERMDQLTKRVNEQLQAVNQQVEQRLSQGFEKTTTTFTEVVQRLAMIDQAQKKITELSTDIVSLQDILNDKRARGALGEVQLAVLLKNVFAQKQYALQYTLSNGRRVDCMLFLPTPIGHIAIDAKFPLENYRRWIECQGSEVERKGYHQQFKKDMLQHINVIAEKYIIARETADAAMLFLPAESVFAEVHSMFPECVEHAYSKRVWLVSPTTLMAVLTTAKAVIRDGETREQVDIIQKHLAALSKDFDRFGIRMNQLAKHIGQVHEDVGLIQTSSKKIVSRFNKIERVELHDETDPVEQLEEEPLS